MLDIQAPHRLTQVPGDFGNDFRVLIVGGSPNDGFGHDRRVARFKYAGADEDTLRAQLHHEGSVGRGGHAAGSEIDHRQFSRFMDFVDQFEGSPYFLSRGHQFFLGSVDQFADAIHYGAHMPYGFDDIAGAGLAFGPNHGGPLADTAQGFTQVAAAANKGDLEIVLPDVMAFIRRCQHFRLVDIIYAEGLQYLGLGKMTDTALGHYRNRHSFHNGFNNSRV